MFSYLTTSCETQTNRLRRRDRAVLELKIYYEVITNKNIRWLW